ncbi:hypothetical protein KCP76_06065 [Salmonella enterica subsp. enterica serovar Weltevreden]|nr:hypothetical protein KCP76_06065 [Salmonella enterica subsp. enterica serovar Weltevreden]
MGAGLLKFRFGSIFPYDCPWTPRPTAKRNDGRFYLRPAQRIDTFESVRAPPAFCWRWMRARPGGNAASADAFADYQQHGARPGTSGRAGTRRARTLDPQSHHSLRGAPHYHDDATAYARHCRLRRGMRENAGAISSTKHAILLILLMKAVLRILKVFASNTCTALRSRKPKLTRAGLDNVRIPELLAQKRHYG